MTELLLASGAGEGSDLPVWIVTGLVLLGFWGFVGWALALARPR